MYYLKFLKWFWNEHLVRTDQKVGFCLLAWGAGIVISFVFAIIFKTPFIVLGYLLSSVGVAILIAAIAGIVYMHRRYIEWQMEVVNKLKGK
jgi:uncharacterized membrane protein